MGARRKNKTKKINRLDRILEMPKEISSKEPKLTIAGFNQMLIENYKGILEYQEFYIRINTYTGIININGFHLSLSEMTTDDIMVTGKIESIDFENMIDEEEEE
ncbi:MAG TPA: YabP/YqfC family sporulation protein [Clostridiaceae bacterium]|jgi:sporulation protein YqfC|nr:YabP/YqfC family sporulation protein [Clostridiaceae bacterium]